jgi:hypothetical protein
MSPPMTSDQPVEITVDDARRVSGLLQMPERARACLVLAHGAGAGMRHPFLAAVATELAAQGIATLRYQFPYMERRSRRPDSPDTCHATVRAAVIEAAATSCANRAFSPAILGMTDRCRMPKWRSHLLSSARDWQ